ncbi:flagellar export chaperone FliS [Neobacillus notoginsengisoli]|uniref:Flagellar export chaperone FliS n=1 Tax=Neobacillus notoginsengisoli TaxID=1578198 RepID=A0A417YJW6_9BACI|nr:flagellar export chaperone FliS [Neobacillus notoginsengisoli]RHW33312.1 flagellar export chaperone FliS [Neobacillus notoginsengisoli]
MLNPNEVYQRNQVTTARPEELTLMLYNGGIKFLYQAKAAIGKNDFSKANTLIIRTQDILSELMVTMNMDYEISNSLLTLYDYMKRRLIEANITKDPEILTEIEGMLKEIRTAWSEAMKAAKTQS